MHPESMGKHEVSLTSQKTYREILIFVIGTTPQIVTEILYALTQKCKPPIFPKEIHIITTLKGMEKIEEELFRKGRLYTFIKEYNLPLIQSEEISIHVAKDEEGNFLDDIRESAHNEAIGDFITDFIFQKTQDPNARLHCSLTGGRKTMSFYLGSALQFFGRPWDKLYHILVSPEFESHSEFYYIPRRNKLLELKDSHGRVFRKLHTKEAQIYLAELPFIHLRGKIPLNGRGFKELVQQGQKEIDMAMVQPSLRIHLRERAILIGETTIDMVPIQMVIYTHLARQKRNNCAFPNHSYCLDCTECFVTLGDLSKRKALEEMTKDYEKIYGPYSGRVEDFLKRWGHKGGIDSDTLRQNISKINTVIKENVEDETLSPFYIITPVGKHGSKRYGIRVEKGKIKIEF